MPTEQFLKQQDFHLNKKHPYLVLARRARPQNFEELIGQENVTNALTKMLSQNKVPHAFLFTGTRGTGKTSSARILAKSLCCSQGPTTSPCQTCVHCKQITACAHTDVLEIDGASNTGVDNIRELKEAALFYPNFARYKIFIIDEVHMLSSGAFNALLKILEEPPQQVIFILATTELHKVPLTIRSRCLTFLFKKIDTQLIVQNMEKILNKDSIPFEKDALILIARQAQGSLRDSLSLLEQALATSTETILSAKQIKQSLALQGEECAEKLFLFLCEKNLEQSLLLLQQADSTSQDLAILMEQTAQFFRQALIIKNVPQEDQVLQLTQLLKKEYLKMKNTIKEISVAALSEIFRLLVSSAKDLSKSNTSALSWAEMTIIDCISRAQWLSASEILSFFTKKSNQQHSDSAQSIPSNPLSLLRDDSEIIDLPFFKQFISIAEKKSQTLSSRLNHTKIDQFNKNIVQFSETPENESYLSFNEKDLKSFWESIEEIGLQNAEFKGKYTPQKPTLSTPSQKQGRLSVSLSQLNSYEKSQKLLEKEKFLFEQEHMKKLKALATEIKIISTK